MIKIEVTGKSIAEVSDKLLAIGASLQRTAVVTEAPVQMCITAAGDMVWEVAEKAPVDPTPAPKSAPAAEAIESPPTTEQPSTTPAPSASASELNFDTDVAPIVLQVVKEKGKPVAQEIIGQFGVEKASLMDPALWPELVDQLKAAL
jgi:hypothetical protein